MTMTRSWKNFASSNAATPLALQTDQMMSFIYHLELKATMILHIGSQTPESPTAPVHISLY